MIGLPEIIFLGSAWSLKRQTSYVHVKMRDRAITQINFLSRGLCCHKPRDMTSHIDVYEGLEIVVISGRIAESKGSVFLIRDTSRRGCTVRGYHVHIIGAGSVRERESDTHQEHVVSSLLRDTFQR